MGILQATHLLPALHDTSALRLRSLSMAENSEVQVVFQNFFTHCWAYAADALLAYDYVLTFHSEVALFWTGGRVSGATILFLLNRYITLAAQIFDTAPLPSSVESAFSSYVAYVVLRASQYLAWAAFSALRSYALCPHPYRWPVSATVFALSSVPIVTNMWINLYRLAFVKEPQLGLIATNPISVSTILKRDMIVEVATRSSMIASDLVVLCVTWYRTYQTAKLSLRSLGKQTFASILLLDGMALLVLSVLQMTFTLTRVATDVGMALTSVIAILEEPITAILTSRFLIDLQNAQRKLAGSSRSVSLGELAFEPQSSRNTSRFIGSLGGQLSFHEGVDREDEVEDAM
ncbi:hypothetical protein BD310DRAFT_939400 [Dichomitus squalens]|uniref:DUF6533 domain-containing protein n=1 Tax=Dichomitus squalens TaxID=114155 RepID=A0A4Q9PI10_9APHY|nr:hypothetical protein BD310DRAFT_939400 [Dichomitus squalens]